MSTIREEGTLECGIVIDGVAHTRFILRPATLADTYRAAESVSVPANVAEDQAARVAYQMAIDDAQILCQIESLGDLKTVPTPQVLAAELDPDDMTILRVAAVSVKKKLRQSRAALVTSDAPSASSSAPASP